VTLAHRARLGAAHALALALCLGSPAAAAVFRTGQPVMGTVLQVTIVAGDEGRARALAVSACAEARRWEGILTTWRADGELAQLNARAGAGPTAVSADLAGALLDMQRLSAATDGAFDPAVGALVDLWRGPAPPAATRIARAAPSRIASALVLDGRQATLAAGAELDAGGIGKGMALDAIGTLLRAGGVEAAYLDFGGSSQLAIGAPPGAPSGWRVAVSGLAPQAIYGVLTLRDAALSTSRAQGAPLAAGPIIDPRSGAPVEKPRLATVRAGDATTAEAWSKAAVILGRDGVARAEAGGLDVLLDDADGVARTPGFKLEPLDQ
jgi:thiamine biosynthesis lipoprotein